MKPSTCSDKSLTFNEQTAHSPLEPGKPKRCLTAYNIFFQQERQRLLKTLPARAGVKSKKAHGKIGFAELGRTISRNWKAVTPEQKTYYRKLAAKDKKRYLREMEEWKASLAERDAEAENEAAGPEPTLEQNPVVTGSVTMDETFVPVQQEPAVSETMRAQDMMHGMATDDLVALACGDTFFETSMAAPVPAPADLVTSIAPPGNQFHPKLADKAAADGLVQSLDVDCQDFLMSAFP